MYLLKAGNDQRMSLGIDTGILDGPRQLGSRMTRRFLKRLIIHELSLSFEGRGAHHPDLPVSGFAPHLQEFSNLLFRQIMKVPIDHFF